MERGSLLSSFYFFQNEVKMKSTHQVRGFIQRRRGQVVKLQSFVVVYMDGVAPQGELLDGGRGTLAGERGSRGSMGREVEEEKIAVEGHKAANKRNRKQT